MREVEIAVERYGGASLSGLDASVFAVDGDGMGFLARLEVKSRSSSNHLWLPLTVKW